ncbi:DUF2961 domain-containing protein [Fulvivirgaceae bacterium BMA10]|uniref:DUF2961 domain-containing protein n=1 Tax=Splendidivirga corallicola TaxID=3051826 RepID=A0ABT8KVU1_9BACT|nr:DUF2961 domain-containing protein [Fulvivirgaceae bacterium BMA10]
MKVNYTKINFFLLMILVTQLAIGQELYTAPKKKTTTRWISPENPTGAKGKGGFTNEGAKGNAFYIVAPGETKVLMQTEGAGIIQRMWMSGTIAKNAEQRRGVVINMYWDGAEKPAVSAPIGDFFGIGLGLMAPFDSELFSNPEGRSFNFTIPMPYRKGAKIEIVNEASSQVLFWYDINYQEMEEIPADAMYFHAHWSRNFKTELGKDFVILPKVTGQGRYIGTNVGVIGGEHYRGTWFGEGEVKIYLDGDTGHASLVGTGTEDYIGTGWGQGVYYGKRFGSLVSNTEWDIYAFYRYHTADQVYFHQDCKVTIQQMGNTNRKKLREIVNNGGEVLPVWQLETHGQNVADAKGKLQQHTRFLDMENAPDLFSDDFPAGRSTNYYRRDDVSATAYFYLNKPQNGLPSIAPVEVRLKDMQDKVWSKVKTNY